MLETWGFHPKISLHWRHNEPDGGSNHQPRDCLLNCLFRYRSKKTSKRVTGLCVENSPWTVNSPHKRPVTRKMFPFDDVIMYHDLTICLYSIEIACPVGTRPNFLVSFIHGEYCVSQTQVRNTDVVSILKFDTLNPIVRIYDIHKILLQIIYSTTKIIKASQKVEGPSTKTSSVY